MAEGFEPYHVPQHSRRDKLRVNQQGCVDNLLGCESLVPLYDPSLYHSQSCNLGANGVKEEGVNMMGFISGMGIINASNSSSSSTNHMFMDPHLSVQDINGSSDVYSSHHYKGFLDQAFHGNNAYAATTSQSLSLSLSSHANNLPLELNLQRYDSSLFRNSKMIGGYLGSGNLCSSSRSPLPLGPFTGYSSVLKGSKFLKPAQQLLEEICDVGRGFLADKIEADSSLMETLAVNEVDDDSLNSIDGNGQTRKKSRLLSLLNEVYKKYKQYYQQMQAVFTSFESVAGISSAAPFATMAIKAMSKHFRCLKNSITEQLQFTDKSHGKFVSERDETRRQDNLGTSAYVQTPFLNPELVDQPIWRPQRGLPERAVIVLRAWLFDHFLHPYPTDTDKLMLAKQTGLSRNQVSNWFINARVRLWKPMVEEIHTLETRKLQKTPQRDEHDVINDASSQMSNKRCRDELTNRTGNKDPTMSLNTNGGFNGVSLTLGLHQNGIGIPETYHINAARRLGLDSHGFEAAANQRPFGTQILHGFQK